MMFQSKKLENIEYFKLHYDDETLHSAYKYFSTISVGESDAEKYINYLKQCEQYGFSFYLYYVDSYKDTRKLIGFSNFEIKEFSDSHSIDLTAFDDEDISRYFCKIFREEGYFIVSDNALKLDSLEEKIFMDLKYKIDRKLHLLFIE